MQYKRRRFPVGVEKALEKIRTSQDLGQSERLANLEESNKALQEQNAMLLECLLEVSEIIYA